MAKIILSMDGLVLKEMPLRQERLSIGRKPHNDIQIDNMAISGEHARIVTILQDSFLEDLDSTNGTLVNGQSVKRHFLRHGDVIELGKYHLKFLEEAPEPSGQIEVASGSLELAGEVLPSAASTPKEAVLYLTSGPNAGRSIPLQKARTTVGRPGVQVAVVEKRGDGYYLTHGEGERGALVNGEALGEQARCLAENDELDIAGISLRFAFLP